MAWYLGITTSKHIAPYPGAAKERGELAVVRQLRDMGIEAHAPQRIDFIRRGQSCTHKPVWSVILPNYIMADIPADRYARAMTAAGLAPTTMTIARQEVERSVRPFLAVAEKRLAEAQRIIERQDRLAMTNYAPGDALEVLSGSFMDQVVRFTRMIQKAGDPYPMIEFETEFLGGRRTGRIDPFDVRKLG